MKKKKNIPKKLFHAPTMLFMLFINKFMNVQTKILHSSIYVFSSVDKTSRRKIRLIEGNANVVI
jgi:hypothetical protein